jgi:hypothetical protein
LNIVWLLRTTPAHIKDCRSSGQHAPSRAIPDIPKACRPLGLEPFTIDRVPLFVNVGER